jgi:DNA-binding Xre family transcriptional regulator
MAKRKKASTKKAPKAAKLAHADPDDFAKRVGVVIAAARQRRPYKDGGPTQDVLARDTGMSQSRLARIEKGTVPIPVQALAVLALALNTTPAAILARAENDQHHRDDCEYVARGAPGYGGGRWH